MEVKVSHIPGVENIQADAISRDLLRVICTGTSSQSKVSSSQCPFACPPSRKSTGLDLTRLGHTVQELFSAGLAQSTVKSYKSCSNKYTKFCVDKGITPFPVEEKTVLSQILPCSNSFSPNSTGHGRPTRVRVAAAELCGPRI